MDIFEFIALIILLAAFLILFAIYYVLPVYIAYRKGKNWKKYILPSVIFGPFVIPFALYRGKDHVDVESSAVERSSTGYLPGKDVSNLEPGEVVAITLAAKKSGHIGVLTFTNERIVFNAGIGSKHNFVIPMNLLTNIVFFGKTIQFSAREVRDRSLFIAKTDLEELKAFVGEMEHPQINPIKLERNPKPSAPKAVEVVADPVQDIEQPAEEPVIDSAATDEPVEVEIERPKADEVLKPVEPSTSITEEQAAGVVPPPPPIFKA